jgi:uncharacterized protein (TIGR03437 family)
MHELCRATWTRKRAAIPFKLTLLLAKLRTDLTFTAFWTSTRRPRGFGLEAVLSFRIRMNWARFIVLAFAYPAVWAQSNYTLNVSPPSVPAGGQPVLLAVTLTSPTLGINFTPKATWVVRWNGLPRPTTLGSAGSPYQLNVTLSAADIARPGFGEISVFDQATEVVYPIIAWVLVTADVNVSDLAYDSVRNRFYVSVPANSSRPNAPSESIVSIDASTGAVLSALNVGSKPMLLAISDDCSYLYVYLSGAAAISRISLDSFTPNLQILLGSQTNVVWMQVVPGAPHSLVVSQVTNGFNPGVLLVYDDARFRPLSATGASRFVFSDPGTIIATGGYNSSMVIDKLTPMGILGFGQGPSGSLEAPLDFADGWILGQNGGLFDLAGVRPSQRADLAGVGAFVPGKGRLLLLNAFEGIQLGAFDENTMTALGRILATSPYNEYPTPPTRMLVWGTDGVAFVTNQQLFFGHTALAAPSPVISAAGTTNAATLTAGKLAPNEIVSIFGANLGLASGRSLEFSAPHQVSTNLGQTQVWFDGLPGTMLYAGGGQINVIAPFGLAGKASTRVQVWHQGIPSAFLTLPVAPGSPGIFTQNGTGKGAAAALNADYSPNTPSQPAPAGSVVSLFATGGGATNPALADGQQDIFADPLAASVQVVLNGTSVPVLYAGSAPGLVAGVDQINFQIPAGFPASSTVAVQMSVGGILSPAGVTISVR